MNSTFLDPRKALNKAFLKIKPNRSHIELFKSNLIAILDAINEKETEEFHKNLVIDFLKKTYYDPHYFVNTKGRNDLVIHNGKDAKTPVGVIIEVKSPSNKSEMISVDNLNGKALQELVLYYLRERITHKNTDLKQLVVTNIYEWFVFDAQHFNSLFAENKKLVKDFIAFENGSSSSKKTDFFYKEIAKPFIDQIQQTIEFAYFDIRTYDAPLRNSDAQDDKLLIALFKLLSPEHLLKLSFANDSNSLDKNFYNELLHLIGLTETKEGGKKLIERPKAGQRHAGSLLENVINQLDSLDKVSRLPNVKQYGDTHEERLFTVGLELCITWVNRILFLKLLEAQLISYHKGDKSYAFLNKTVLHDYDNLNALFFMVLAKKPEDRNDRVKTLFAKVPYLNSSLFEPTELEHLSLFISGLEDSIDLPFLSGTVIKDTQGKKRTGAEKAIAYFFDFLDAYDFASEGSEDIQEDNKTLINASVLGLIFEKINGYKDGSFYTPSFITMYMCKETIRRAVVQKFNETKGWDCQDFLALQNKDFSVPEANAIINSVKICDPAVGSGHFLVSALNEMIAIKHDLKVLVDREGKRLKEYQVEIVNDELMVTDEDGLPFAYNPINKESQRVQETFFHEKQTIIENCLFGVDINPNSVKICRLRLWIELLKNAYYRTDKSLRVPTLETLPNIDINIKCGNSLIARFGLNADLKEALQKSNLKIDDYKRAVDQYRNAESKEQKREMETLIEQIKSSFRSDFNTNDPKLAKIYKLKGEVAILHSQTDLFGLSKKEETARAKKTKEITTELHKLEGEIEELKSNKIYENAFEWRFEFPEVLNDQGDFVGFDVVIGNPPYVGLQSIKNDSESLSKIGFITFDKTGDLYVLFCERGNQIIKLNGDLSYIIPNKWMNAGYGKILRKYLLEETNPLTIIDFEKVLVFDEAVVFVSILNFSKQKFQNNLNAVTINEKSEMINFENVFIEKSIKLTNLNERSWQIVPDEINLINSKIENRGTSLANWNGIFFNRGITTGLNEVFIIDKNKADYLISKDSKTKEIIKPLLRGRDIKRYFFKHQDLFLINTYNGENNPEKGKERLNRINVEKDYPVIYDYMLEFKDDLIKREDKGDHWTNLRNCAFEKEFVSEKIIWLEISDRGNFTIDSDGMYLNNSAYFISGHSLKYLVAVLNSKLCDFYFFQKTAVIAGGRKRYTKQYVEQNPIPIITEKEQQPFIDKVDQILTLKKDNPAADTSALEREIDVMVYALYGLTEEEIKIVEGS
jgi:adenine-specific DNA-methyltransferase